jgi:hypothetical protein
MNSRHVSVYPKNKVYYGQPRVSILLESNENGHVATKFKQSKNSNQNKLSSHNFRKCTYENDDHKMIFLKKMIGFGQMNKKDFKKKVAVLLCFFSM